MSPVKLCENGKYRIGNGDCIYDSKEKAEKAYKAYLAKEHSNEVKTEKLLEKIDNILEKIEEAKNDEHSV